MYYSIILIFIFFVKVSGFCIMRIKKTPIRLHNIRESLDPPEKIFPINGFYGLIGPNINHTSISSLYDLFTGDGVIQGVFLENGMATFVQTLVKTDKLEFESIYGKMPKHILFTMLTTALYHLHFLPNMLGVANTAFMTVNNRSFALFERDMPYELAVDFQKKEVRTVGRYNIPFLTTFSGHSKVVQCPQDTAQLTNTQGGHSKVVQCPQDTAQHGTANGDNSKEFIETIEYHVLQNKVTWYQIDTDFKKSKQYSIHVKYIPMTHDFYSDKEHVIIIDSPLLIDWKHLSTTEVPIHFNEDLPTYIYVIHKENGKIDQYISKDSFYLFHYGSVEITDESITIIAPFYDTMNYNTIYHSGKYRKLYIDRKIGVSHFIKMKIVENLNLDFPVKITKNRIILRSIKNNRINGFYIFNDLQIIKKIIWNDRFICGEPAVTYLKTGEPILMCLAFSENTKQQFFMTIHLETYELVEYLITYPLFIGFHATFIEGLYQ